VWLAAACATPVDLDYDPQVHFDALHTWAWATASPAPGADPRASNDLLDARIRRAVDAVLTARGYRHIESGEPDFRVAYHAAIESKLDVDDSRSVFGYPGFYRSYYGDVIVRQYDVGTLMLDILSGRDPHLIWRASTHVDFQAPGTPEQREARIREAVSHMLQRFPPR